jgi:hypothetical protein
MLFCRFVVYVTSRCDIGLSKVAYDFVNGLREMSATSAIQGFLWLLLFGLTSLGIETPK